MATLTEFRAQHPEYNDMSDTDLAGALHRKFYSDMPFEAFAQKAGIGAPQQQQGDGWSDVLFRATPLGMAKDIGGAIMDPAGAFQKVDDSVRMLANGATLGFADKLAGYMGGTGTEDERAKSAAAKERLGITGDVLEAAGTMIPATKAFQMGATATRIPGFVGKYGGMSIDGSLLGGLQAYGNDQDVATGMGIGGLAGLLGTGVTAVAEKALKGKAIKAMQAAAPTEEAVKAEKNALYSALDNAEVKFDASAYEQMLQDTSTALKNFRATKAPMTADTVQYMAEFRGKSPSFRDVEDILQEAKGILREPNATQADKAAARVVVDNISNFFDNAALSTNGSIPAGEVAAMAKQARELARRTILAREIGNMEDVADGYLGGEESALRNKFGSYLRSNKRKGLTDTERAAFKKVVRREGLLNLANIAGSRLGQTVQLGAGLAAVPLTGGASLLASGAGLLGNFAVRKGMEHYTKKSAEAALKTVLAGKAAQSNAKPNPAQLEYLNSLIRTGLLGAGSAAISQAR